MAKIESLLAEVLASPMDPDRQDLVMQHAQAADVMADLLLKTFDGHACVFVLFQDNGDGTVNPMLHRYDEGRGRAAALNMTLASAVARFMERHPDINMDGAFKFTEEG